MIKAYRVILILFLSSLLAGCPWWYGGPRVPRVPRPRVPGLPSLPGLPFSDSGEKGETQEVLAINTIDQQLPAKAEQRHKP
jgi:hypothetical protein